LTSTGNACFLGVNKEQQRESQQKLADAVVGVAGCGGLGSYLAIQLARVGIRHIKIADPDSFEESNINRQLGAGANSLGRNKALVVGDIIREMTPDVTVDIYPEGLQRHTAESFVSGTDLLFDCTDFYLLDERYALHRAYRGHSRTRTMLCACIWGWGTAIYKFDRNGVTYEQLTEVSEGEDLTPQKIDRLVRMQANYLPRFPSVDGIFEWMKDMGNIPIHGAIPPIAHGFLTAEAMKVLCDLDKEPYNKTLPSIPEYLWIDTQEFSMSIEKFDGNWINESSFRRHFPEQAA
jgi:ThiF family